MNYEDNPSSIKYYVKKHLVSNSEFYKGKTVVDFPAGNGVTTRILRDIGAKPIAIDLFPEYFKEEGLECVRANIRDGLPLAANSIDSLICQEGIEHFSDQYYALREFNRVLKAGGTLLITTPNYSNIRSKLSYLLSESERFNELMPPNEIDSIWMSNQEVSEEIYFGHIFLIGIQKLRVLAKLSGFRIKKIHMTKRKSTSMLLFPFLYPFILWSNWLAYRRNLKKSDQGSFSNTKAVYKEVYKLAVDPKILIQGNLMIEFEKEQELESVAQNLKSKQKGFGIT